MSQTNHPLPPGFMLETYRIERQLAHGGFSIVYLAHDAAENPVAIKEYLPNSLALRSADCINPEISPRESGRLQPRSALFFEEGRAVAKLDHPYLVK
ncbi:MAG: hypothetical protein IPG34_19100 [Rhodocyclaceae bacterium]|nr:hypothetical protein [Rhodocyclaceae bacterium]